MLQLGLQVVRVLLRMTILLQSLIQLRSQLTVVQMKYIHMLYMCC